LKSIPCSGFRRVHRSGTSRLLQTRRWQWHGTAGNL